MSPGALDGRNRFLQVLHPLAKPPVVLLMVLFLLPAHGVFAQSPSAQERAGAGILLARQNRLPEAEQDLRKAVQLAPEVASYRAQLGSILGLQGKWEEALESFLKAIDLDPTDIHFRRETAAVQWQIGLMPAAEKNLRYVLERHPDDAGAILLLGLVSERTGDYANAARLLDSQFESVISQPDRAVALFHSLFQIGQPDKTARITDVLKVRASDKLWASAIDRCAQIAATGGDLPTAQMLFALISERDSGRLAAGYLLAKLLYTRGQVSQAKDLLLQLAEHGRLSADAQALLGNCFESERQRALAIQAYQRAIEMEPSRVDYYQDLISLLLDSGKTEDAIPVVNHALAIAPNNPKPWVWKGELSLRRNAYQDAIASYSYASKLDSSNAEAALGVAAVHFVTGQIDAAIAAYRGGILRFPNDARFYVGCAQMLLASPDSLERRAEAENLLQKAVKLAPQSAEAHYQLGQLALSQKRLKDAEAELLLSIRSDPDRSKAHFALSVLYRRMGRTEDASKHFETYQVLKQAEERGSASAITAAGKQ